MSSAKDIQTKRKRRVRRKKSIRKKIFGTETMPRLTVSRSNKNIACQIIDDHAGKTLASSSTRAKDLDASGNGGNCDAAKAVGKAIGEKAKSLGIEAVQFDRNGYRFHGRVKALADAAREAGLKF